MYVITNVLFLFLADSLSDLTMLIYLGDILNYLIDVTLVILYLLHFVEFNYISFKQYCFTNLFWDWDILEYRGVVRFE